MPNKLQCVLLVDDDEATNFINQLVIEESGKVDQTITRENGYEALKVLSKKDAETPIPELIFVDINMPGMDGFEFLDRYEKLDSQLKSKYVVVMLTTSVNPADRNKAFQYKALDHYLIKPLTLDAFMNVLNQHFPHLRAC